MIISRTPFRVSLFGGGTDFPAFFGQHGGAVLAGTINQYCYLSIHRLPPLFKHRFRASYSRTESVLHPAEFQHPLIRETLLYLDHHDSIEISHTADLPGQTGLGSSSSFTVGLLNALHAYRGHTPTPDELAQQAIAIERERVGDAGGWQDQYEAAYGGLRRYDFHPDRTVHSRLLPIPPARRQQLERHLLLFYLGIESSAAQILHAQNQRAAQNQNALLAMRHMVNQAEDILCNPATPLNDLGALLHEGWQHKQTLAAGISNPRINQAYQAARTAGALGGKLLGAGSRGFFCLYAEPHTHPAIRQALSTLRALPVAFSPAGSQIIFKSAE